MSRQAPFLHRSVPGKGWMGGGRRKRRLPTSSTPSPHPSPWKGEGAKWARGSLLLAAIITILLFQPAIAAPERVVSINLCTDQLLVLLADRDAIASVSFLAADKKLSYVADQASGLPTNHGLAEEILALDPDLVLAGEYGAGPTVRLLKALDMPVVEIGLAEDFESITAQTRTVAAALGVPERGEALIDRMRATLAAAASDAPGRPDALIYQADGFTAGTGTLADVVFDAAGFGNAAAEAGLVGYGYLSLEKLIAAAPDVVIIDKEMTGAPSLAHAVLQHPAIERLDAQIPVATVPAGTMACGGPYTARAVAALATVRDDLLPEDTR